MPGVQGRGSGCAAGPRRCHMSHVLCHGPAAGTAEPEQTASMGKAGGAGNFCCLVGEKLPWGTGASWVLARCIPERSHPCAPFLRLSGSADAAIGESQSQVCVLFHRVTQLVRGSNLHWSWGDMDPKFHVWLNPSSEPLPCSWPLCMW